MPISRMFYINNIHTREFFVNNCQGHEAFVEYKAPESKVVGTVSAMSSPALQHPEPGFVWTTCSNEH